MDALINVVIPVFSVVLTGYLAGRLGYAMGRPKESGNGDGSVCVEATKEAIR